MDRGPQIRPTQIFDVAPPMHESPTGHTVTDGHRGRPEYENAEHRYTVRIVSQRRFYCRFTAKRWWQLITRAITRANRYRKFLVMRVK